MPQDFRKHPGQKGEFKALTRQVQLEEAVVRHRQGDFAKAAELYQAILASDPAHLDALHLLGVASAQLKKHQDAANLIAKAIAIDPKNPVFYSNRGIALKELNQLDAAVASFDTAIRLKPDYAEAWNNRGNALQKLNQFPAAIASHDKAIGIKESYVEAWNNRGNALKALNQLDAAVASFDRAIALKPDYAEAWNNRGNALKELKQFDAAIASYDRAIALRPDYADAWNNRGNALFDLKQLPAALASYDIAIRIQPGYAEAFSNRGNALMELQEPEGAIVSYDMAIRLQPNSAEAYSNRGTALLGLKRPETAVASFDNAIRLKPDYAEAYSNRGNALKELKRWDEALISFDLAIKLRPDYAEAHSNRGVLLQDHNLVDAAIASYDRAIASKPDYAEAYWNKSLALLARGDLEEGWKLYEWRWKREVSWKFKSNFSQPKWSGQEALGGKTILLYGEQGLGDTIQFCRYVPLVAAKGARVVVDVLGPLVGLLRGLEGVSDVVERGQPLPPCDFQCPMMSLPLAFQTNLTNIPLSQGYLRVEDGKVAKWVEKLGAATKRRVGIVWSGSTGDNHGYRRSILLSAFLSWLPKEFEYVSLQKDLRDVDRPTLEGCRNLKYPGTELEDFTDTAALCHLVDAVISIDTSVAHLCGALGKTTFVLLPHSADWRWLLDRSDSPWYASVKLYRQAANLDWTDALRNVRSDLLHHLA